MPFDHHKDRPPRETIAHARSLLSGLGILMREGGWRKLGAGCHAVHLVNVDLAASFSNGKGVTEELALASAYAEYLERIQNLAGTPFLRDYGAMPGGVTRPDETDLELSALLDAEGPLMERLLGELASALDPGIRLRCVPFYDVFAGRTRLLPDLVYEACQGNGMCAGNSPEEAMIQGLCEVFERHVVGGVYRGDISALPTVPHEAVAHLASFELVREIVDEGFGLAIKDGSLGGRFPVVGTVVTLPGENRYRAYFGSAPDLDTALQRCLTEWFQGTDAATDRMNAIRWEAGSGPPEEPLEERRGAAFSRFCNEGTERFVSALFTDGGGPRHEVAFREGFASNRDALAHLVGLLGRERFDLLVRDASFLGFPAYTVYVPGLAETELPLMRDRLRFSAERADARRTLLDLTGANAARMNAAIETLERILAAPELFHRRADVAPKLTGIQIDVDSEFADFHRTDYLLALLNARIGEDAAAARSLARCLREEEETGFVSHRPDYHWCAVAFFSLRARGAAPPEIARILADLFTSELAEEVVVDLADPAEIFRYHDLPKCGDCRACPISGGCLYPGWRALADALQRGLDSARIDQARLGAVFEGLLP